MKTIKWWKPIIGNTEHTLIKEVLDQNFPNEGHLTRKFEDTIKKLLNCKYTVTTTSGTSALFLALKALNIGYGDEVLIPDITFIATANAVKMAGATPVLIDISNHNNALIDSDTLEQYITPQTKAVIPVHVSGRAVAMEKMMTFAKKHNLFVIEDAAEAFMSQHKGKYLGTWADAGCFSFSPHKIITTGQGGIIVTNNQAIYNQLILLKDHGRPVIGTGGDDIHHTVGYNFKLTNLQAAVGLGQLEMLPERINHQKKLYQIYQEQLHKYSEDLQILPFALQKGEVPLWCDALSPFRNALVSYLKEQGIETRNFWHPLHTQKPYLQQDIFYKNSVSFSKKAFWLPSNVTMTEDEMLYVTNSIKKFFEAKKESFVCQKNHYVSQLSSL